MDPATGLITVQTARLGRFQVRQASRAESFTILQMTPRRIFTPNGDGINDVIEFFFENDADWVVSEAKVYDLSGAEVSAMRTGSTGSSYVWDGKDRSGQVVHGGIYIYQFQAGGKTLNGTVVVAK
jgi:flagellar hook assembly protein FlgD